LVNAVMALVAFRILASRSSGVRPSLFKASLVGKYRCCVCVSDWDEKVVKPWQKDPIVAMSSISVTKSMRGDDNDRCGPFERVTEDTDWILFIFDMVFE